MKAVCKYRQPNENELDGELSFVGLKKSAQIEHKKNYRKNGEREPSLKSRSSRERFIAKKAKTRRTAKSRSMENLLEEERNDFNQFLTTHFEENFKI